MVAAGATLEEAVALTATANTIIQDADVVGTALKSVAMRLRGTSVSVLEEEGLDTDGAVESISKLQSKIMALSGVNILTDTGEYKSTYEILSEIAAVWEDISDMDQAALLELIAGKRSGSVMSAILQNPQILKDAFESANDAAGSALAENEKYLDSIQGKIDQFTNSLQTMWSNTLDSDLVKGFVQFGTELIKIIDKVGLFNIAFIGLFTYLERQYGFISGFFKPTITNVEQLREQLVKAQAELKKAEAAHGANGTRRTGARVDAKRSQVDILQKQLAPYEEVNKLRIEAQEELIKKQEALAKAQQRLDNYKSKYGDGAKTSTIKTYTSQVNAAQREVDSAKTQVEELNVKIQQTGMSADAAGTKGAIGFKKLGAGAKTALKAVGKLAAQMLAMYAITVVIELISKVFDAIKTAIDDSIETAEETQEKFEQLKNELADATTEVNNLESELGSVNDQIEELQSKGSLSFTDEEDLKRLQAESAELERQLTMNKVLQNNLQKGTNAAAVNANNQYLTGTSFGSKESKSERKEEAEETGETIGSAAGLAIGAAIGSFIPGIGTLVGAGIGALVGSFAGGWIGGAIEEGAYNKEQSVGEAIDNMVADRAQLQQKVDEAFEKKDTDAYKQAIEDLNEYDSMMAQHMSQIQANVNSIDYATATDEQKKQVDQWNALLDRYAITMGAAGSKNNAITRIFGLDQFDEVAHKVNLVKDQLEAGSISAEEADKEIQKLIGDCPELVAELGKVSVTTEEAADSFVKLGEKAAEAKGKLSSLISPLSNAETALKSLGGAFEEFEEDGIITASTLDDLQDTFGHLDGFEDFIGVLGDSSSTTEEVTQAISNMASEYLLASGILDDVTEENKAFVISQLEALGVTNADEYLTGMQNLKDAMANEYGVDLSNYGTVESMKAAIAGTLHDDIMNVQGDTLDELASNYGYDLSNFESVEKAKTYIAMEEAKKRAGVDLAGAGSDQAALRDGRTVGHNEVDTGWWIFGNNQYEGKTYSELNSLRGTDSNLDAWLNQVDQDYNKALESSKNAAQQEYNDTIKNIDGTYDQLQSFDDYVSQYAPKLSFNVPGLGGGKSEEEQKKDEAIDAFQEEMDYWERQISANQAKYEQVQNEIDLLEKKGMRAGEEYYREQIALEQERQWLVDQQIAKAKEYLATVEEGSDEWWTGAEKLNDLESERDDIASSILDKYDAMAAIKWDNLEEVVNRFSDLHDELSDIRDVLQAEEMFDDEGNFTSAGTAVVGSYVQELEMYKNELTTLQSEIADLQAHPYNEANAAYLKEVYSIDSEQEYNDLLKEWNSQQRELVMGAEDAAKSLADVYSEQVDAIEDAVNKQVEAYNDYIDVVKEAYDAERD